MTISRSDAFLPNKLDDFDERVFEMLSQEPLDNLFNININEIIQSSKPVDFVSTRYNYRPDLVAWDYYQSLAMTNLILLANNCVTIFNFTRELVGDKILLPDSVYIKKLLDSTI